MELSKSRINCQKPANRSFINREHIVIKCLIKKGTEEYKDYLQKAIELADSVNPNAANASAIERENDRKVQDAFAGVLAEQGWLAYLNRKFGQIASSTPFTEANGQIDILLNNGERIEVRSSFIRNGVRFGVCSDLHSFKIIGAYANLYKPGEVQKEFYASALFDTKKDRILTDNEIYFSLTGGATKEMMKNAGFEDDLVAEGDLTEKKTRYKLLRLKDANDIEQFEKWMNEIGY